MLRLAVIATISKGYDLDYIWAQVDPALAKNAAGYYLQPAEAGGEPPGRWWGPGVKALGLEPGQQVDREPYDLLFGERKAPDGTPLGRPPSSGKKAADLYAQLTAAEPHTTAERKRELRLQATRRARQGPLFFDLTLSLSKSVSIFHASLGENARLAREVGDTAGEQYWSGLVAAVDAMIYQAVHAGFAYFQREAGYTRTGSHGKRAGGRETGQWREADLVVAHWLQHTSRDGDMQLHVHSQVAHVARTVTDGKWRAPDSLGYNEHVGAVGAITAQHLEEALTARFGIEWTPREDGHGFEIAGISAAVMRVFSSRRESITKELRARAARFEQRYGRAPSQRELAQLAQAANFATRKGKEGALDLAQAHQGWADKLARTQGISLASVAPSVWHAAHAQEPVPPELALARAAQQALAMAQQEKSAWTRADLVKYLGRVLPRTGRDPAQAAALLEGIADRILRGEFGPVLCLEAPEPAKVPPGLLRADGRSVHRRHGGTRYATRAQLGMEEQLVAQAHDDTAPRLARADAARALGADLQQLEYALTGEADAARAGQRTRSGLREDQAAAALSVLADGRRVSVINAPAGAGKTRVLAEVAKAWQAAGLGPVIGITASQSARNTLAAGVPVSYNSARFLGHLPGRRGARGPVQTGPGALLLVDEASMMSGPDLADLITLAQERGGKVVLAGDTMQLQAVQNGGGMALLAGRLGHVRLAEPVRFRAAWERAATLRLRDGDTSVLAEYDRHARIAGGDPEQVMDAAASAYVALFAAGTDVLLMTADHALRRELSRRVRDDLARLGLVAPGPQARIADGTLVSRGDLILCTRNDYTVEAGEPGRALANGDLLRVEAVTPGGLLVRRALDADPKTGRRRWTDRQFLYANFHDAELGYAVTGHAAQGRTVHTGMAVLTGSEDRQHAYVALTRGTTSNTAYVFTVSPKRADPAPGPRPAPELARYDRTTERPAGPAPGGPPASTAGTADAVAVLAEVLGRDGQDTAATQDRQRALADADHLAVLHATWAAETAPAREHRYRRLLAAALPAGTACAPGHRDKWLWRTLDTAELAGLDPARLLAAAVAERDLTGARDIPAVLDDRIRRRHGAPAPLPFPAWSARVPATGDPERDAYLTQLAALMDDRKQGIGEHAAAAALPWATGPLGPVPADPEARQEWQRRAAAVGAYRELSGYGHPADPIGPEPGAGSPELRAAWHEAAAALSPDGGPGVRGMTDGQLLRLRQAYPAETAWAPPWPGDALRRARTTARDAHLAALRATAEAGAARRRAQHAEARRQQSHAASYHALRRACEQQATALDTAMEDRAAWERATRERRERAVAADAELRRRHPAQPWHPLRSAEPAPQHDGGTPAHDLAKAARLIEELAARHQEFTRKLAERHAAAVPTADPGAAGPRPAFPAWAAVPAREAVLQPPRPQIEPSARVLERAAERDAEPEAGG